MEDFSRETGKIVSFDDAAWVCYFTATGQEHKLKNDLAQA